MESERANIDKLVKELRVQILNDHVPSLDKLSNFIGLERNETKCLILKIISEIGVKNKSVIKEYKEAFEDVKKQYETEVRLRVDPISKEKIEAELLVTHHLLYFVELDDDVIDRFEDHIKAIDELLGVKYDQKRREERMQKYQELHDHLKQHSKKVDDVKEQISGLNKKRRALQMEIGQVDLRTEAGQKKNLKLHQKLTEVEKKISELLKQVEQSKARYQKRRDETKLDSFGVVH